MIDARGRSCPEPVMMIKKAMDKKEDSYQIVVDNKVSVENVTRYARHNGYQVNVQQDDDTYTMTITKD
ncbi:MAG: sulfurtransferase TusA family protein [Lachnospiraceae bacterium]